MLWLYLLALVIIGIIVVVLSGRWDGAAVPEDHSDAEDHDDVRVLLESRDGPITASTLEQVRFGSALRGYRMDQVDALLDALTKQLHQQQSLVNPSPQPAADIVHPQSGRVSEMTSGHGER